MPATPRRDHALLAAALLACAVASSAVAQPTPQGSYDNMGNQAHVSTTMIVLLAAVVAVFVFIAFSTIYLRHCTGHAHAVRSAAERSVPADAFFSRWQRRTRGLDAEVIETFPTMKYAEAKALRLGKVAALECAVCLSEFEDHEQLRFLPKCSHAFHPDCIGEWLASHVTCPVCRSNLDPNKDTSSDEPSFIAPEANSTSSEIAVVRQEDGRQPSAVVIDVVTAEEEEERMKEAMELQQIGIQRRAMRSRSGQLPATAKLVRSHSTGHSLAVRLDRDLERYTLRLPEHVRREMVAAGEQSSRRGRRVGEGSGRRAARSDRLGRSGRWSSFLTRTFSGKLPFFSASRTADSSDGGEVSSSSSTRVKGKRVAAVDVADGPAKGTVRLDRIVSGGTSGAKVGAVAGSAAPTVDVEKATSRQVWT